MLPLLVLLALGGVHAQLFNTDPCCSSSTNQTCCVVNQVTPSINLATRLELVNVLCSPFCNKYQQCISSLGNQSITLSSTNTAVNASSVSFYSVRRFSRLNAHEALANCHRRSTLCWAQAIATCSVSMTVAPLATPRFSAPASTRPLSTAPAATHAEPHCGRWIQGAGKRCKTTPEQRCKCAVDKWLVVWCPQLPLVPRKLLFNVCGLTQPAPNAAGPLAVRWLCWLTICLFLLQHSPRLCITNCQITQAAMGVLGTAAFSVAMVVAGQWLAIIG